MCFPGVIKRNLTVNS
uniref:Uncharacterized protein n=1 Tax=Anguilla anguilla TaxID=7936 RepID=A0A0E9XHV4_ANGAN